MRPPGEEEDFPAGKMEGVMAAEPGNDTEAANVADNGKIKDGMAKFCTSRAELIERLKRGESPNWLPNQSVSAFILSMFRSLFRSHQQPTVEQDLATCWRDGIDASSCSRLSLK